MADIRTVPMHEVAHADARSDADRRQAVAESTGLLDSCLSAWCGARTLHPDGPPLITGAPVLYQVGLDLDSLIWVALVRFTVDVEGQRLQGLVRGPAHDPVFRIEMSREHLAPGATTTAARPAERRRRLPVRQRTAA